MPIQSGQYVAPTFINDSTPALDATEMNAMASAVAGAVEYDRDQRSVLDTSQQSQARRNIGASSHATYTAQAVAANWTGSSAPYTNVVTVSGITATDNIVVGLASSTTSAQYSAFANGMIVCSGQAANTLTFLAYGVKPTVAINFSVIAIRS